MMTGFSLVKREKVKRYCSVGFGNGEDVGERCATRDNERKTLSRASEEFDESVVWNKLRRQVESGRSGWVVWGEVCVGCLFGVGLISLRLRCEVREARGGEVGASRASGTGDA